MANVAALKKKAADFEAKKQIDKAIATYREVLDAYENGEEAAPEIALYNRVGDLLTRQGNTPEAVTLYEKAVDLYTEGGFFNNAIALCNKVLRTSPGRASVYYKLGKISAAKGFKGEAKQNFLEYADRMQKSGAIDEAFRALKEFADLVPDQDDVRLMLADQLTRAGKKSEALDQLQVLYGRYEADGRAAEAQATADRMKAIDPAFEPRVTGEKSTAKHDDLIFIDLDAPTKRQTRAFTSTIPPRPTPAPPAPAPVQVPEPSAGFELISASIEGETSTPTAEAGSMLGLEPTSFTDAPAEEAEPMAAQEFAEIDLAAIPEAPATTRDSGISDLALGGDLPLIHSGDDDGSSLGDIEGSAPSGSDGLQFLDVGSTGDIPLIELETTVLDADSPAGRRPTPTDMPLIDVRQSQELPALDTGELVEAAPAAPTSFGEVTAESVDEAPPLVRRASSMLAANSVMTLRIKVEDEPENWALRRRLGEALLEDGERDEGLRELEVALAGYDKGNDLDSASSVADEIVRINPASVRYHQKRVEYAFRTNDKSRTGEAYLALADSLFRDGQTEKARQVYHRVLELFPGDLRAEAALQTFGAPEPEPADAPRARSITPTKGKRYTGSVESVPKTTGESAVPASDDDFVSLGDWLRDEEGPKNTRMVVAEEEPTGDEQADFADMLKKFKQGVAENVEEEDHESHYDLGVAFKEMGLLDEAISEFQKALRGTAKRARTFEALGQCFLEKKSLPVATTILTRALNEPGIGDEQLVGVLYLLGYINEALNKPAEAKGFYERVFAVDIQFRDVGDRLNAVDKATK